jgi:hypothetical protein
MVALGSASWLLGQSYDFVIDSEASGFEGAVWCRADLAGFIAGDWGPSSNPEGTVTLSESAQVRRGAPAKIGAQGRLALRAEGRSAASGSFRLEQSPSGFQVRDFQLDFLFGSRFSLEGSLVVRHRAFGTCRPWGRAEAGTFLLGLGGSWIEGLKFAQTSASRTCTVQIGPGRWRVEAQIPGALAVAAPLFGEDGVTVNGLLFVLRGELQADGRSASLVCDRASLTDLAGSLEDLPELSLPSEVSPVEGANLILWFERGRTVGKMDGRLWLVAESAAEGQPLDGGF